MSEPLYPPSANSAARMVLVMCVNAGVDRTYEVENFTCGGFHRPTACHVAAGGKGLNVARALAALALDTVVTGFFGGFSGDFIFCDLDRPHLYPEFIQIRADSRTTLAIRDSRSGLVTRLDEWGPPVSEAEVALLHERWEELLPFAHLAVVSGNPPPAVGEDFCGRLVARAREMDVAVLVDLHETHLREALLAGPAILTPNLTELSWLAGRSLSIPTEVVDYSRELVAGGVGTVLTTLGAEGALLVTADTAFRVLAPQVDVVSAVGAGDCAVAGWVAAGAWGLPLRDQARWAVAAGSACCLHTEAAALHREELESLLARTSVSDL